MAACCITAAACSQVCPSDQFLVIASDGLWNVMSNQEVVDFILEAEGCITGQSKVWAAFLRHFCIRHAVALCPPLDSIPPLISCGGGGMTWTFFLL